MPTPTYVAIAKTVLSVDTASVIFSAIPSTYTDLLLLCSVRGNATYSTNGGENFYLQPNGSTSTSVNSVTAIQGTGAAVSSLARTTANADPGLRIYGGINHNSATANTFSNVEIYIPNYNVSQNRQISSTAVTENNSVSTYTKIFGNANLFQDTTAITSLTITYIADAGSRFVSGSRFDLYGIKNS